MFAELQAIICLTTGLVARPRAMTRVKWKGWSGYSRRNFMTPLPVAKNFEALNAKLEDACRKRHGAILRGQTTSIAERMRADVAAFMPLPAAPMPVTGARHG